MPPARGSADRPGSLPPLPPPPFGVFAAQFTRWTGRKSCDYDAELDARGRIVLTAEVVQAGQYLRHRLLLGHRRRDCRQDQNASGYQTPNHGMPLYSAKEGSAASE